MATLAAAGGFVVGNAASSLTEATIERVIDVQSMLDSIEDALTDQRRELLAGVLTPNGGR